MSCLINYCTLSICQFTEHSSTEQVNEAFHWTKETQLLSKRKHTCNVGLVGTFLENDRELTLALRICEHGIGKSLHLSVNCAVAAEATTVCGNEHIVDAGIGRK